MRWIRAVCVWVLAAGLLAPPVMSASAPACWRLDRVEPVFKQRVDEAYRVVSGDGVRKDLDVDSGTHWLEYDQAAYPSGRAYLRASWSTPPKRFCANDLVTFDMSIENKAVGQRGNVLGSVSSGPQSRYGTPPVGRLTVSRHEKAAARSAETRLARGPESPSEPAVWLAQVSIGHLYAQIRYHYVPHTATPASAKLRDADVSTHAAETPRVEPLDSFVAFADKHAQGDSGLFWRSEARLGLSPEQERLAGQFGPPDHYNIRFLEDPDSGSAKMTRVERWYYEKARSWFQFVDGRFESSGIIEAALNLRNLPLTPPDLFEGGLTVAEVNERLLGLSLTEAEVSSEAVGAGELGELVFRTGYDLVLGYRNGRLVLVLVPPLAMWNPL